MPPAPFTQTPENLMALKMADVPTLPLQIPVKRLQDGELKSEIVPLPADTCIWITAPDQSEHGYTHICILTSRSSAKQTVDAYFLKGHLDRFHLALIKTICGPELFEILCMNPIRTEVVIPSPITMFDDEFLCLTDDVEAIALYFLDLKTKRVENKRRWKIAVTSRNKASAASKKAGSNNRMKTQSFVIARTIVQKLRDEFKANPNLCPHPERTRERYDNEELNPWRTDCKICGAIRIPTDRYVS